MRRSLLSIAGLALLLFAIDQLFRVLYPEVNLVRASLVGLTALIVLAPLLEDYEAAPRNLVLVHRETDPAAAPQRGGRARGR